MKWYLKDLFYRYLSANTIILQVLTLNMISFTRLFFINFFVKVKCYGIYYSVMFAMYFIYVNCHWLDTRYNVYQFLILQFHNFQIFMTLTPTP